MDDVGTIGTARTGAAAGDVSVRLDGVSKHFGTFVAVDDVDLDVQRGEFFSLLGPSHAESRTIRLENRGTVISTSTRP